MFPISRIQHKHHNNSFVQQRNNLQFTDQTYRRYYTDSTMYNNDCFH